MILVTYDMHEKFPTFQSFDTISNDWFEIQIYNVYNELVNHSVAIVAMYLLKKWSPWGRSAILLDP